MPTRESELSTMYVTPAGKLGGGRFRVRMIKVCRRDGSVETDDFAIHKLLTFAGANLLIRKFAETAPKNGSTHRVTFHVRWENDAIYEGEYEMTREDANREHHIERHILDDMNYWLGNRKPEHMTAERYASILRENPVVVNECREMLETLVIGDEE